MLGAAEASEPWRFLAAAVAATVVAFDQPQLLQLLLLLLLLVLQHTGGSCFAGFRV